MLQGPVTHRVLLAVAGLALATGSAFAQDSVSSTPVSGGDAIGAYDTTRQTVRYAVDTVDFTTSWGATFGIAPLVKASLDTGGSFNTLALGAVTSSPDAMSGVGLAGGEQSFSVWTSAGAGVGAANGAPGSVSLSMFDTRFGVAFTDFNTTSSNIIGAMVGLSAAEPDRFYVRRTLAAQSRPFSFVDDNATLAVGGIDASGRVHFRADDFNSAQSNTIDGENIVTVDLFARSSGNNGLTKSGGNNTSFDTGASTYAVDNESVTLNTPAALSDSGEAIIFDFAGGYAVGSGASTMAHLDAGVEAHRGNPSFSKATTLGGVGTVGSLAVTSGAPKANAINLFSVDALGNVVSTASSALPSPLPGTSINASGDAHFDQYLNQTNYRGPSGHVAVGSGIAAATGTDPALGAFVAVTTYGGSASWSVAAKIGDAVLDGPGGTAIGTLVAGAPASISAPAIDAEGKVYFVALFDDGINPAVPALIRATEASGDWERELVVKQGDAFTGANSATPFTISKLALADADSIASAGFNAGSVQSQTGVVLLAAEIEYDRSGTPERYQTVLGMLPKDDDGPAPSLCTADLDGNFMVDLDDFSIFIAQFGNTAGDCAMGCTADLDGVNGVDLDDFSIFIAQFGNTAAECDPN